MHICLSTKNRISIICDILCDFNSATWNFSKNKFYKWNFYFPRGFLIGVKNFEIIQNTCNPTWCPWCMKHGAGEKDGARTRVEGRREGEKLFANELLTPIVTQLRRRRRSIGRRWRWRKSCETKKRTLPIHLGCCYNSLLLSVSLWKIDEFRAFGFS